MSDNHIDRAAQIIAATDAVERGHDLDPSDIAIAHTIAMSLNAAGLLATEVERLRAGVATSVHPVDADGNALVTMRKDDAQAMLTYWSDCLPREQGELATRVRRALDEREADDA